MPQARIYVPNPSRPSISSLKGVRPASTRLEPVRPTDWKPRRTEQTRPWKDADFCVERLGTLNGEATKVQGSPGWRNHLCGAACLRIAKRERLRAKRSRLELVVLIAVESRRPLLFPLLAASIDEFHGTLRWLCEASHHAIRDDRCYQGERRPRLDSYAPRNSRKSKY